MCIFLSWHYGNDGDVQGLNFCLTRIHVLSRFPCEHHWSTCRSVEPNAQGTGGGFGRRFWEEVFPSSEQSELVQLLTRIPSLPPLSNWVKGKAPSPTCCCLCGLTTDTGQTWQRNIKLTVLATLSPCWWAPKSQGSGRAALPSSGD